MATFVFFDEFKGNLGLSLINLNTNTFKVALTNTAPTVATDDELADITQITAANGYSAGGATVTSSAWAETGAGTGVWRFTSANVAFTASGGSIGPFRYAVLYSDTSTNDKLVGYLDYGSNLTLPDGGVFTITAGSAANGWFELDG